MKESKQLPRVGSKVSVDLLVMQYLRWDFYVKDFVFLTSPVSLVCACVSFFVESIHVVQLATFSRLHKF